MWHIFLFHSFLIVLEVYLDNYIFIRCVDDPSFITEICSAKVKTQNDSHKCGHISCSWDAVCGFSSFIPFFKDLAGGYCGALQYCRPDSNPCWFSVRNISQWWTLIPCLMIQHIWKSQGYSLTFAPLDSDLSLLLSFTIICASYLCFFFVFCKFAPKAWFMGQNSKIVRRP